jgi:hypothetical protein
MIPQVTQGGPLQFTVHGSVTQAEPTQVVGPQLVVHPGGEPPQLSTQTGGDVAGTAGSVTGAVGSPGTEGSALDDGTTSVPGADDVLGSEMLGVVSGSVGHATNPQLWLNSTAGVGP